ncbi:MAG: CHAT domain-containing protein [Acidobacteriota bacterium]
MRTLVQAAARSPNSAKRLSDAAAALFVRAQIEQNPLPLLTAYGFAERATAADPTFPRARFNRALIEETLGLYAQGRASWTRYLALDPSSTWAGEARSHFAALRPEEGEEVLWPERRRALETAVGQADAATVQAIVDRFRQKTREHLLETVLPVWGRAVQDGKPSEAKRLLRIAQVAGAVLAKVSGDITVADAVADIEASGASVSSLARAFVAYGEASQRVNSRDFVGAEAILRRPGDLAGARSSVALETDFLRQRIAYQLDRFDEQRAIGRSLLAATENGRRPALRGRVLWSLATTELLQGHPAEGIAGYRAAEQEFARSGLRQNLASVRGLLAGALSEVGDNAAAWELRLRSLRDLAALGEPSRLRLAASSAAFAAEEAGEPAAARAFVDEALAAARVEGKPMPIARVLLHRAELAERTGTLDDGFRTLAEARRWGAQIASESDRRGLELDLFFTEGRLLETRNPRAAVARLSETLDRFDIADYRGLRPWALRSRAQASLAAGDDVGAERDLGEAVDLLERAQSSVPDSTQAIGFLDQVRAVYEQMIALQIDLRHRPDRALEFAERGRARRLREQLQSASNSLPAIGLPIHENDERSLRAALAPGLVALVYQDLPDRLLIWKITREDVDLIQVPIARADLEAKVQQAKQASKRSAPEAKDLLAGLYDLLLRPVGFPKEADLDLLIIPSGPLWGVPFAGLWDRKSERYLVERATLRLAPSLGVYKTLAKRGTSNLPDRVLVVADPASDSGVFALRRLPGTRVEARAIANAFPKADLLEGAAASPVKVLARLPNVSILHFAVHAVADSRQPFLSYLVLAPSEGGVDSGALYAKDLFGPPLPSLRLAVLSACNTLGTHASASEGVLGLTWPFLARGARNVIASLWETGDINSAKLFTDFYAELSRGTEPAKALRAAQSTAIQARMKVEGWSAFAVVGP